MNNIDLFTMALGLTSPWSVSKAEFLTNNSNEKELHLWISFESGFKFTCPDGSTSSAYDTLDKTWRHLNFFQHRCYIHCHVARVKYGNHKICMVEVPWAHPNSGFTLLFEAYTMLLIEEEMPVSSVSRTIKETSPRIWRVFRHWVNKAYKKENWASVKRIGVDETSSKRGHKYITQFVDLDRRKTLFVTKGKGAETFDEFKDVLEKRGGKVSNIKLVSMDMSIAFISGYLNCFPKAEVVFDKFHIVQHLNKAMDQVRRLEHYNNSLLKGERYTLLYRSLNLPKNKIEKLNNILVSYPLIGQPYGYKESFMDTFSIKDPEQAKGYISFWCDQVMETELTPFKKFVKLIKAHWFGITSYFDRGVSNGILEGLNSKIQLAKRRARGYTNIENFISMIYFITGKLKLDYPHDSL